MIPDELIDDRLISMVLLRLIAFPRLVYVLFAEAIGLCSLTVRWRCFCEPVVAPVDNCAATGVFVVLLEMTI